MLDLLIRNGTVIDGTGRPSFRGDVAVKDGVVVQVTKEEILLPAGRTVDAAGMWVVPGFIDIHRHGDLTPFYRQPEREELRQGITTFINGNCGFSAAPSAAEHFELLRDYARPIMGTIPDRMRSMGQKDFLDSVSRGKLCSNMGYLVGNGALRIAVKGFDASPVTRGELERIRALLRESLEAGAMGLSLGLMYVPENFYTFRELEQICRIPAEYGRIVTAHIRGEGSSLLESVQEITDLAKASGGKFHISHLKAAGRKNWHRVITQVLELLDRARGEGVDISFDMYPYCAGSTAMYTLLPPGLMEGGMEEMLKRLADPSARARLKRELQEEQRDWDNLVASTGWQSVVLAGGREEACIGRSVEEIAGERNTSPQECMMDLMLENAGNLPIVFHSMCPEDMEQVLRVPDSIVISDALYTESGIPHPRRYGSFSRLICQYGNMLGIEETIRRITWNPARRMGIPDRGRIEEGMKGDLVVLDPSAFSDRATYEQPDRFPEGICMVTVNGKVAGEGGKWMDGCFGELLKGT